MLHTILRFVNGIPPEAWQVLAVAFLTSPAAAWIKHKLEINKGWIMFTGVTVVSFGSALVAYLLRDPSYTPWFIAIQGAVTYFATQPYYYGLVRPIGGWLASIFAKSQEFDEQVKSAAVPDTGVPLELSSDPVKPGPDFSK